MVVIDEMERAMRDRSQTYGFRFAVCARALWTLYELIVHFLQGGSYNPLPSLLLCGTLLYQIGWESYLKHSMVKDAEDFQEPNALLRGALATVALAVVIIAAGIALSVGIS